jgi:hypothetical protein
VWESKLIISNDHPTTYLHVFDGESGHVEVNDKLRGLITYDGSMKIPEIDAPNPI